MVVTEPDRRPHERASMFVIERGTPGMHLVRDVCTMDHPYPGMRDQHLGGHAEIRFSERRVPMENLIGRPGEGFLLAQRRLSAGRIHHAMRWIGMCRRAFDMMCERAASRELQGEPLGGKQFLQDFIAESATEIEAARLLTLHAAWKWDLQGSSSSRIEVAQVKYWCAGILFRVIDRAIQVHGALGYSSDLPLEYMYRIARNYRISDGVDEVHKAFIARHLMRGYEAVEGWPSEHVPTRRADAESRFAEYLDLAVENL
jgi:acyl-CoA dehydrogenase